MDTYPLLSFAADRPYLRRLAEQGPHQSVPRGTLLIKADDLGDTLYLLLRGSLRVYVASANGRQFTLAYIQPGEWVGEMSLDGGSRSAHVEAVEDSLCVVVSRETLLAHIRQEPALALDLLRRVIARARNSTRQVRDLALLDVYSRLVNWLDTHAEPTAIGDQRKLRFPITQSDLAQRIGCTREMVGRLLRDLQVGGYIDVKSSPWILLKRLPARW